MSRRLSVVLGTAVLAAALLAAGSARAVGQDTLAISPPADVTEPATVVCGQSDCAEVDYTFTVTGGTPPYRLVCNLPPGLFIVGTHVVSCLAQDSLGNSTPQASFTITVTPGGPPPPPPPPPPPTLAIAAPADMTAVANTPCGATFCVSVSYTFTVTGGYPPYRLVCNFYSGNLFTVGSHVVSCLAQDNVGDSTPQASFTVTVTAPTSGGTGGGGGSGGGGSGGGSGGGGGTPPAARDTTAPIIRVHANIALAASSPAGAVATYHVTVADPDNTDSQLTISCTPASGSTFPLGHNGQTRATTVTCTAHDPAGNSAAAQSFTVTVLGARSQIAALEHNVAATTLTKNQKTELDSTLARAERTLASGSTAAARSQLRAFIAEVRQLRSGLVERRASWIVAASRIARVLS